MYAGISIRDMSADEALEQELLQAQKMAAIGLLTANVAHDFNNALTALRAQLYFAELQLGPSAALVECQMIVDRCCGLTDWLLQTISPRRTAALAADRGVTDLGRCVGDAVRAVQQLFPSNIRVQLDLAEEAWVVSMEPNSIVHALLNLLMNARDALPDGGTIEIGIQAIGATRCRLCVADTGSGMAPETLQRAFEPFFTTKAPGHGTGLGLPSVRRIVERAGGRVTIESEPGKGTCVTVELPRAHGSQTLAE